MVEKTDVSTRKDIAFTISNKNSYYDVSVKNVSFVDLFWNNNLDHFSQLLGGYAHRIPCYPNMGIVFSAWVVQKAGATYTYQEHFCD